MQGLMILPEDVQIVPLAELPAHVQAQVSGESGDFALTRPKSRTLSKVIDSNAAALLQHFRKPITIVDAILSYSREMKTPAAQILEEAYPLIESCLVARLLVEPGTQSEKILPSVAPGDSLAGYTVERVIQTVEDSEVLLARSSNGQLSALKVARSNTGSGMKRMLAHEASILERVGGAPAPCLNENGVLEDGRPFLAIEWFDGDDSQSAAQKIRERDGSDMHGELARLCAGVLDAYGELHSRGVIHADIHPNNVLVSESGEVRIIDFGVARLAESESPHKHRAGVAFFFEPECAEAMRTGAVTPPASFAGEQYGLGALVYLLLSGTPYLDFSFGKEEMLRQIVEDRPRPLANYDPALEAVVLRALDKDPSRRFASTADLAASFRKALAVSARFSDSSIEPPEDSLTLLDRVLGIATTETRIPDYTGPLSPTASVTYGAAGMAYALYRIAGVRDDAHLFALADGWAERAANEAADTGFYSPEIKITTETVGRVSPYHGPSGVAAVQALLANARGDQMGVSIGLERFLQLTEEKCDNPDLTLGQSSVLLTLCLLLESAGSPRPQALVDRGNVLYESLLDRLATDPPIGQAPGGDEYLGIAHGWAGLIYTALRWCDLFGLRPPQAVQNRLRQLSSRAQFTRSGARWPVMATAGSISMAGWCNGSAGHTFLWTLAHKLYHDPHYLDLAERAAMDAFEGNGGGHGLCCGFAGQAYAQLSLYKHTGERRWLEQARRLAEKAAAFGNMMVRRDEDGLPHSLYKGDVGAAVLIVDLERPETAAMPFFEE